MKKLSAALLLYLGLASAALAQTSFTLPPPAGVTVVGVQVVTTCGVASGLTNNGIAYLAMNTSGQLCTNASGGGGGAATIADGADVTQGAIADAASTAGGTGTLSAKLRLMTTQLGTLNTTLGSPFQAGGALAANQSVNVAQFGGISTATGQVAVSVAPVTATNTALVTALRPDSPGIVALGQTTKSASVPVAIASDQVGTAGTANATVTTVQGIASMTKLLVTPDSVALPANQSVNVAQVNGVTTLTGTGAAGTGTQRVTLSNTDPCMSPDIAKSSVPISITSATTTSLVAVSGSTVVYVCGISFSIAPSATTADSILFEYGTGAACTSPTTLTGTFGSGDLTTSAPLVIINYGGAGQTIFKSAASAGICALSAGNVVNIQGVLTYVQQ